MHRLVKEMLAGDGYRDVLIHTIARDDVVLADLTSEDDAQDIVKNLASD